MDECLPPRTEYGLLRKATFGRTNLFLATSNAILREIRCSANSVTRHADVSIFHNHLGNQEQEKPEMCACWHCCHAFDGKGFRLPRIYDPTDNLYHVYGWFCSANCAKGYILEHSTFDRGYQMNIFTRMLREVYGIHESIIESPPRLALKMFGGPFDIETFRTQKNVCFMVTPPFISYSMLIEERQPISNIGEEVNTNVRGTVRGLRRPSKNTAIMEEQNDVDLPLDNGLYKAFLEKKMSDPCSSQNANEPPAKKPRTTAKNKNAEGGLAKFAYKK